jgi:tetratricopeptide (TPR) repeat protein
MERKKYFRCLMILLVLFTGNWIIHAQNSPRDRVYQAYVSNQMDNWDRVIVEMKKRQTQLTDIQQLELINYYYGYIGWAIEEGMDRKAKAYISEADELIEGLLTENPDMPELYAYKGALIGFTIGLNQIKAVILGPESIKNIDHALEIGPDRHQCWIEKGNALFYMPKVFGGSKERALENYNTAIRLMEQDPEMISNNWMYLNVLMILGQSYEKTGDMRMAKTLYEKVLQIEPGFTYMRDELYPSFMKKWEAQR